MQKKDRVKMATVFAEMLNLKTSEDMAFRIIHYNDFKISTNIFGATKISKIATTRE